jgi:hemophore-related protein
MGMVNVRYAITAVAVGGFAAGIGLSGAGTASADLIDDAAPLLTSTCSFVQIDSALHDVAPAAAARLDAAPLQKSVLRFALSQPADERQAMFGPLTSQRERLGVLTDFRPGSGTDKAEAGAELRKVADTCHSY